MTDETTPERVSTGIAGLDIVLEGGLLRGGVYIVEGPPGAGKTILANQMCFAAARRGENVIYVTLLAESHARMLGHLHRMSFFDASAVPEKVYYLSALKVLEGEGIDALFTSLRKAIGSRNASLVVVDGLISAEESAPTPRDFRKFIHELQTVTAMNGCCALLLSSTERPRGFRPEHTMVDGVIELIDEMAKLRSMRHVQVRKLRGSSPVRGKHTLLITDDGIVVVPRVETQLSATGDDRGHITPGDARMAFGIAGLDEMLYGGVKANSVTMVLGPSGAGKTILGLQFLAEGARQKQRGIYFGFYEHPEALRLKMRRLRIDDGDAEKRGLLEIIWTQPVEGSLDLLGARLFDALRKSDARRLVIDGLHGFQVAADAPDRIRDVFSAVATELERRGVTTLYTVETPDLFGPRIESPIIGISTLTHNIMLLRHVELNAHLHRLVSLLQVRDGDYDAAIREFRIADDGIIVADTFASADHVLTGTAQAVVKKVSAGKRHAAPKPKPKSKEKRSRRRGR